MQEPVPLWEVSLHLLVTLGILVLTTTVFETRFGQSFGRLRAGLAGGAVGMLLGVSASFALFFYLHIDEYRIEHDVLPGELVPSAQG